MAAGNPGPVIPQRYIDALGGDDPIESMRKAPKRLKKLLKGLSEKQLARRPEPAKWSIKEAVAHLADGEVIIGSRLRFVAAEDRPPLKGYDQDAFVERLGVDRVRTSELLEAFAAARALNIGLLRRLPAEAHARVGLHSERGEESIAAMIQMYAGHDRIHEAAIAAQRDALRAKKRERRAKAAKATPAPREPKTDASEPRKKKRKAKAAREAVGAAS